MFRTPSPIPTHEEPWASVLRIGLREAAVNLCGHLALPDDPPDFRTGIFDRLTSPQKIAMLAIVGKALLDPNEPAPRLTAVVDATLASIMEMFHAAVEIEADTDADLPADERDRPWLTECRTALLKVVTPDWSVRECGLLPDVNSVNTKVWRELAEGLDDCVLWDIDCELEYLCVDDAPEAAARLKRKLGIDPDYFSVPAPDPTPEELVTYVSDLAQMTGERLDAELVSDRRT